MADEQPQDTHYEVTLDDEPAPTREPVYVDVVAKQHEVRPIIPASLRRTNLPATLRYHTARTAHRVGYHAARSHWYTLQALFWSLVGVFRLAGRQLRWWWHPQLSALLQHAADHNDVDQGVKVHNLLAQARTARGLWLLGELVGLTVAVTLLAVLAPWWLQLLAVLAVVPFLAHVGRPVDRRIVSPAIVTPRFRRINADIVLRAYYAAGLGRADKRDQEITFGSTMARDPEQFGSFVVVDLPFGKTFADVVTARAKLASGLDVTAQQVFLTADKTSERRHLLYVADRDMLALPAGKTPLLDLKPRDVWKPAPFGLDERGRKVSVLLLWISILVGAQPRKGKTFATRALALFVALDPFVPIIIVDGKNAPDWKVFRPIAHRLIMGTVANPFSRDPITELLDALDEIIAHIEEVNSILSTLPASECPEGKLTRELSRKYPNLRVWLLVMEEFQYYYETDDQDVNKRVAGKLSYIRATGPSAGVILLSSTQKPSGVGAGDVARLFNRYRDNHDVRFALKSGNRNVSEAILGGDAYSEGYDASSLPVGDEYRGVGYLYGLTAETPTVRTFLADQQDAELIIAAARRIREAAGTLTGQAAGEDMARQVR